MNEEDPFVYPKQYTKEEWKVLKQREAQKRYRDKKRGGPPQPRGGKREGAGRKSSGVVKDKRTIPIFLDLTRIQVLLLVDKGNGILSRGVQALVEEHL